MFSACNVAAIRYAKDWPARHWYAPLGGRNAVSVMVGEAIIVALLLGVIAMIWAFFTLKPRSAATARRSPGYSGASAWPGPAG